MMSALAGSYTESWLVGDISGRSTFWSCATATCCPITTCVTTCSPPRGGPSCSFTGAAALASATGMMRTASPGPSTAVKPCVISAERKIWYPAATAMGRAETMVTCPLTRGSISILRPVICDIALTTACRSAPWKLSTTSPDRGVRATPAAPGARAAGTAAGDTGVRAAGTAIGDSTGGAPGDSGVCAEAAGAATASAPARIRAAIAGVFVMNVRKNSAARGPSAHIVVQGLVAALPLHVHEHALSGAELLVQTHDVVHAGERLAVDVADHVPWAQAELLVQASRLDLAHQEPSVGVGHDQGLIEEFRPTELLLQLPPVDELPVGADRLNDRRRRGGNNPCGATFGFLHEHRFAHAVAHDHDAIAFHRVQPHSGRNLFARAESRLGLSLNDDQRAAAGRARGDAGQRHVQVAGRDARFGCGTPRGSAPEKLHAAEPAQIGEVAAPGARHRGRGRLEHAPGPLRQSPAQQ